MGRMWEFKNSYECYLHRMSANSLSDGDIINLIDNNQKVGIHSSQIKEGSKVPSSICTTICHILPQPTTEIQYNLNLSPGNWINKK